MHCGILFIPPLCADIKIRGSGVTRMIHAKGVKTSFVLTRSEENMNYSSGVPPMGLRNETWLISTAEFGEQGNIHNFWNQKAGNTFESNYWVASMANPVGVCVSFVCFIFIIFFRVGKSLACHSPAKWCLCA